MVRRIALTLLVAVAVLIAGCVGGGGGVGPAAGNGSDDGGDATPTATPEAPGETGGTDTLDVTDRERVLREAGSFTATWNYRGTDGSGETGRAGATYAVDLSGERSLETVYVGGYDNTTMAMFTTGDTTYTQLASDTSEEAFYMVETDAETTVVEDALDYGGLYETGDRDDLRFVGTETFDGVTVSRYETSGDESFWWTGGATGTDPDELDSLEFEYVLLVDADGLARHEAWTVVGTTNAGERVEHRWQYELTGVGSTTVEDPDWLPDAKTQG